MGKSPFVYYEPKVDYIAGTLAQYRDTLEPNQRAEVDKALEELKTGGEKSRTYKEAADRLWLEARSEFERDGLPVQRVKHAPVNNYRTAVNNVAGNYAAPMLYGADKMMTGGVGSAVWPTFSQDIASGTSPEEQKVTERLRQRGILPQSEEARGQEYDPLLSTLGGIGGLLAGGPLSLAGQANRLGTAAAQAVPAFLRGTTLSARLARAAMGGGVSGATQGGATGAVDEGFEAAHGNGFSVKEVASQAAEGGAAGAAFSTLGTLAGDAMGAVGDVGKWAQGKLRETAGIGEDLNMLESVGGNKGGVVGGLKTMLFGAQRSDEGAELVKESLQPRDVGGIKMAKSQLQSAVKPIADHSLNELTKRIPDEDALMKSNNDAGYRRLSGRKAKTYPVVDRLMNVIRNKNGVFFTDTAKYKDALEKSADLQVMWKTDPRLQAGGQYAKMEPEVARNLGFDVDSMMAKVPPERVSSTVIAVKPKELSAEQFDQATRGLGDIIKWGKDVGSKDSELRGLYKALVKTREQFGVAWAKTKADHDEILRNRSDDMEALGLQGKDLDNIGPAERSAVFNAWSNFGKKTQDTDMDKALMRTLRDPKMSRRAQAHVGNEAYNRLSSGESASLTGGPGGLRTMVRSAVGGAAIRTDPLFGAMSKVGSTVSDMDKSAILRSKVQELVGPGVKIPDSLMSYIGQLMGTAQATFGDEK